MSPPDRRAIVTGGAGFVGSHLVERLAADGWSVLVVDDLSTGRTANLRSTVPLERLDIAIDDLGPVFRTWQPNVVFHLAAQASVASSMREPIRDLAVNVTGTHRVLSAARDGGAERFVFVSSGGAIYGERRRAVGESAAVAPTSYYGVHKLAAEGHVRLSGLAHAIVRPSNIYGPRQSAGLEGAVIAAFVHQARTSQPLTIDGDGRQTRDFIHVGDVVEAICQSADPDRLTGTWNIASGRRTSIIALAALVERITGVSLGRIHRPARAGDVHDSAVSAARLRATGWRPTISLADGIAEAVRGADDRSDQ